MGAEKITFFKSYFDAVEGLPAEQYKEVLNAVFNYVFNDIEPENLSPLANGFFILMKPNIDTSLKRSASGKQGGSTPTETASKPEAKSKQTASKPEAKPKQNYTDKDKEKDKGDRNRDLGDRSKDKGSASVDGSKTRRHKHGEYGHVLLTDDQYESLTKDHGKEATEAAIKKVDEYCEESGKTYKNYKLVLEKWGFKSAAEHARSGTTGGYVDAINHRFDPVAEWMEEHNDGS